MKLVIFFMITLFATGNVYASPLSCEQQLRATVASWLDEGEQIVAVNEIIEFSEHSVFSVEVGQKMDLTTNPGPSIPAKSTYNILVQKESLGACSPIDSVLVTEVQ